MAVRELPQEELVKPAAPTKSNIRQLAPEEQIEEKSFLEKKGGQFLAGLQDVSKLLVTPIRATLGEVVYTPGEGFEHIGPDEAFRREESGELDFPGAAKEEPQDTIEAGLRFAGQTVAAGPIGGRIAAAVKPVKKVADTRLGRLKQFPQKIANQAGETFKRSPIATTAIEGGLGFTAGAGGHIATQIFPDSDGAKFAGEILGGITPQVMPLRLAISAAGGMRNLFDKLRHPFTDSGGVHRAKARTGRAVPKENEVKVLEELDTPTTIDPETNLPVLTPAQRTGENGLLSLERSIVNSSEDLLRDSDIQIARANSVIQESINDLSDAPTSAVSENIEAAHKYMEGLLDTRVRVAAQKTAERVDDLGPSVTRESANRVAREEIESALAAARTQERELYALIDPETPAPFINTLSLVKRFKRELPKAQQEDIDDVVNIVLNLDPRSKTVTKITGDIKTGGFSLDTITTPPLTTIKELRGVQSKLREVSRNARAGDKKNLNQARIADKIADAITDDIAENLGGHEMADTVKTAIAFSRNLNERFSQGTVGKLLAKDVTGGKRVPASLTLEETIGMSGPKARENLDNIVKAFDSPESPGAGLIINSTEDYLRGKFLKAAVDRGQINVKAAQRFISQNEEILGRLPGLRNQLDEVVESGNALAVTERQRGRIILDDPKVSKATMYIERGPVETFKQTAKMKPKDAAREVQLLVNRVAKDETGEAAKGLKSGFVEFLLVGARGQARDVEGKQFLSGFAMRDALSDPSTKAMVEKLFTKPELERINIITQDLIRIEKRRIAPQSAEGILGDRPSKLIEAVAGIVGAGVGRNSARKFGMGGTVQIPGIMASRFRDMVSAGVKDPAGRLLRDAVNDETLFRALLEEPGAETVADLSIESTRALQAWAFNVLAEYGGAFDDGEDE